MLLDERQNELGFQKNEDRKKNDQRKSGDKMKKEWRKNE